MLRTTTASKNSKKRGQVAFLPASSVDLVSVMSSVKKGLWSGLTIRHLAARGVAGGTSFVVFRRSQAVLLLACERRFMLHEIPH
jgi:hypothetical protein